MAIALLAFSRYVCVSETRKVSDIESVVDTYEYLQVSVQYCTEESGTTDLHIDKLQELINT